MTNQTSPYQVRKEFRQRFPLIQSLSDRVTYLVGKYFPSIAPLTFVLGYPRSGTVWITGLLADYSGIPYVEFSLSPLLAPVIYHGHERVSPRFSRGLYVLRDGRDVLVSLYFFLAREIPRGRNPSLTFHQRKAFPGLTNIEDVEKNFPKFVKRQLTEPTETKINWSEHVRSFQENAHPNFALVKYEEMLERPEKAFGEAIQSTWGIRLEESDWKRVRTSVERFRFERATRGRRPGEEDQSAFRRKGVAGDWRNYFDREAAQIFDHYCGKMLIELGYETDRSWVDSRPKDL